MHGLKVEVTRFTIVGAANFVLTFVVFYVLVRIVRANHLAALASATLLGMVFTYSFNYVWVFRPEVGLTFRSRFAKYVAAGATSLLLNLGALELLVTQFGADPFLAQCALMPFVVVFNFATAKYWSLSRIPSAGQDIPSSRRESP